MRRLKNFDLDILSLCDGNNSMTEISKKTGLSYKTIWELLNSFKRDKIINWKEEPNRQRGIKPIIIDKKIEQQVDFFRSDEKEFYKLISKKENKKAVINLLEELSKKRFLSYDLTYKILRKNTSLMDMTLILSKLQSLNMITRRTESTKKGKIFLRKNKKKFKNHKKQ